MVWTMRGAPKPFSAHSVARIRIRSISGFCRKVSGSTSGRYGLINPISGRSLPDSSGRGRVDKIRNGAVAKTVVARRSWVRELSPGDNSGVYRQGVTHAQAGSDVEVSRHVAETAERLHNRLAE